MKYFFTLVVTEETLLNKISRGRNRIGYYIFIILLFCLHPTTVGTYFQLSGIKYIFYVAEKNTWKSIR